jgi:hypothetical protein
VIHHDDLAALDPDDVDCEAIEGWGDYRMRCGIEVAVSFEDPGIRLIMEGGDDLAGTALADAIAAQVERATGRSVSGLAL